MVRANTAPFGHFVEYSALMSLNFSSRRTDAVVMSREFPRNAIQRVAVAPSSHIGLVVVNGYTPAAGWCRATSENNPVSLNVRGNRDARVVAGPRTRRCTVARPAYCR